MPIRHQTLTRFGKNVRSCREAVGLSQEALAEKADLDRTYVSGIERGVRNPTILSAARVAAALALFSQNRKPRGNEAPKDDPTSR